MSASIEEDLNDETLSARGRKPCRACTDFRTWASFKGGNAKKTRAINKEPQIQVASSSVMEQKRVECPLDIEELGRSTWSFLHTMAAYFPSKPSQQQQSEVHHFIRTFSKFYPCPHCADDFRERLKEHPVDASSRRNLSRWMCEEHNVVNRKLGKKEFNCELVDQRWRDGWKDGSCD